MTPFEQPHLHAVQPEERLTEATQLINEYQQERRERMAELLREYQDNLAELTTNENHYDAIRPLSNPVAMEFIKKAIALMNAELIPGIPTAMARVSQSTGLEGSGSAILPEQAPLTDRAITIASRSALLPLLENSHFLEELGEKGINSLIILVKRFYLLSNQNAWLETLKGVNKYYQQNTSAEEDLQEAA